MGYEFKGRLKNLIVDDIGIHIHYAMVSMKGDKTIPFSQVVSVQIKKPGLTPGYMYFQTVGSSGTKSNYNDIMTDDNSLVFSDRRKIDDVLEIKAYVERMQLKAVQDAPSAVQSESTADEIMKFKSLMDSGVITQEEFEGKKKRLLGM